MQKLGTLPAIKGTMNIIILGLVFGLGYYAALCYVYFLAGL